jgi:dipeptidyl aminopeptidase/acylaminoacyl peptidase
MTTLTEKYESNGWPSIVRPDLKPPTGWNLAVLAGMGRIRNHALSPDGQTIAFVWDRDDQSDLYRLPLGGGWPQRLTFDRAPVAYWSDGTPQWSPDGQWLAFTSNDHVHVMAAAGGLPRRISDFTDGASGPIWLPDSHGLIVSVDRGDSTQLVLTDRDGSWPRPLVTRTDGDAWDAQVSADGRLLAYTFRPFADLNRLDIHVLDVANGTTRVLTDRPAVRNWRARWSPDGQWLAYLSQQLGWNDLWRIRSDGSDAYPLVRQNHDVDDHGWSPDGTQLVATLNRDGSFDLIAIDAANGAVRDLHAGMGLHMRPCWSPDSAAVTVEYENPTQPPDLYHISVAGGAITRLTHSFPPALADNAPVMPEIVRYVSQDGLEIPAFLFRPKTPNGAAIVHPHGGPSSQYVAEWDSVAQWLVAKGYTFLAPNYRGSTGYGVPFEQANYGYWGIGDTQDCLAAARYLHTVPGVDPERIAIYGASYGGYMVACCLARDPDYLFACGVNKFGDANIISSWAQCNRDLRLYSEIFLGHPAHNRQAYLAGSPILQVDNIRRPVLVLHGLDDTVVPPQASEEWVHALRRADKTFEYKTYAGEPHGFLKRSTQLDVYSRVERFLDWYLLPPPPNG